MMTAEIAAQYVVPMPETCKELDWQKETNFVWFGENLCILCNNYVINVQTGNKLNSLLPVYTPAPQMHEIVKLLPRQLIIGDFDFCLKISPNGDKGCVHYELQENNEYEWEEGEWELVKDFVNGFDYENRNIAQAAAELYLKLKSKNLLCQ